MRRSLPREGCYRGQSAALTGAASGIGRELALALGRAEADLALADINEPGLADVVAAVRRAGGTAEGHVLDVTDAAAVSSWADTTAQRAGGVQMIWNVAGIINAGDALASSLPDIEALLAVDFWGVVHGTKAFLPHIIAAGGGRVVNVSSAFGLLSAPAYGGYNAAKFAVRGWTDALRQEMRLGGHPVAVTCVYPGGVRTPIMSNATSAAGPEDARRRRDTFNNRVARTEPDRAAALILRGVAAGRPRVLVGADAHVADLLARLTATGYERWLPAAQQRFKRRPNNRR